MSRGFAVLPGAIVGMVASQARESRLVFGSWSRVSDVLETFGRTRPALRGRGQRAITPGVEAEFGSRGPPSGFLGFSKRDGAQRNWVKTVDEIDHRVLADEAAEILHHVYGVHDAPSIALTEDDREHPSNPDLYAAMRTVARGFDEETRRAMYTELVNAVLLVPLDPAAAAGRDATGADYHVFEALNDWPVLGAFTDWTSLRLWEPRGWDYAPVHGSELFEQAIVRNVATVRINPGGDVGGELYRHEVDSLVDAVRTFRRRNFN